VNGGKTALQNSGGNTLNWNVKYTWGTKNQRSFWNVRQISPFISETVQEEEEEEEEFILQTCIQN